MEALKQFCIQNWQLVFGVPVTVMYIWKCARNFNEAEYQIEHELQMQRLREMRKSHGS